MPKRVTVTLTDEQLNQIEDWRSKQRPIPPQNDAVLHFIDLGLKGGN